MELFNGLAALTHLLHLPTVDDITATFARFEHDQEQEILKSAFSKFSADAASSPIQMSVGAHLGHVENLDEQAETVDAHGAVHFRWTNPHYVWNTSAHPGVDIISRMVPDYAPYLPWLPKPHVHIGRENYVLQQEYYNLIEEASQLTIKSDGSMILSVPFSLRIACNFVFTSFPYDEHTCHLVAEMRHAMDLTTHINDTIIDVFNNMPNKRTGEFSYRLHQSSMEKWRACIDVHHCNATYNLRMFTFQFVFARRTAWRYRWLLDYPILACAVQAQTTTFILGHDAHALAFAALSIATYALMRTLGRIAELVPASSDGLPLVVIMAALGLAQLTLTFVSRAGMLWAGRNLEIRPQPSFTVPFLKKTIGVYVMLSRVLDTIICVLTATILIGLGLFQSR